MLPIAVFSHARRRRRVHAVLQLVAGVLLLGSLTAPRSAAQDTADPDAGAVQSLVFADSSYIVVDGTSNRSDWTVHAPAFSADVRTSPDGAPASVTLTVDVQAMESRKSTIMDRLMRGALDADTHDTISFVSDSIDPSDEGAFAARGELELAGTKQPVTVAVTRGVNTTGQVVWEGSVPLLMTDFGIKPPKAMFGALHTGNEVTVRFRLVEE